MRLLVLCVSFIGCELYAQTALIGLPERDLGLPPTPPLVTFLGLVNTGKLAASPQSYPSGRLKEIDYEEVQLTPDGTTASPQGSQSEKTKFNDESQPVEVIQKQFGMVITAESKYENSRLVSEESSIVSEGKPARKGWSYWKYDSSGRLVDFKRGNGDSLENHFTNFHRDGKGRVVGFEYHQFDKDELASRTEYKYSSEGNTVTQTDYDATGAPSHTQTELLGARGEVTSVTITERDWKTKAPKRTLRVAFHYDSQLRLIEQDTDNYEPENEGVEFELPPGKVTLVYDDANHTRKTSYQGKEGSLTRVSTLDSTGAIIADFTATDSGRVMKTRLECSYDARGNWVSCKQLAEFNGSSRTTELFRRTIFYKDGSVGGETQPIVPGNPDLKQSPADARAVIETDESELVQAEQKLENAKAAPVLLIPVLMRLETIYSVAKRNAELETVRTRLVENWATAVGESELVVANNQERLAQVLTEEGKAEQAEKLWDAAIETIRKKLGSGHPAVEWALKQRLKLEQKLGQASSVERTKADLASLRLGIPSLKAGAEIRSEHVSKSVSPPRIVRHKDPDYPEDARKACLSGTVALTLVVSAEGIPDHIKVVQPLGMGLDEAAEGAVREWFFEPGKKDGIAVPVIANVEVNFRLL